MGDRKGTSARRKSRRLAKADAQGPTAEPDAQQLSSPDRNTVSGSNYDLSPRAEFSMLPENQTLRLQDDDSSSSITPPPPVKCKAQTKAQKEASKKAAKKAAKKAVAETVTSSDDTLGSDSDSDIVPPPKKRKKDKGRESEISCDDQRKLILSVPRASEPGNQRITFTHATDFTDALAAIHTTVGCTDVARKPVLTYKLSNAAKSVPVTSLSTDSDWKGCLEDVRQAENAKKAGTVIPVMILVTEQYLNSLSAKRGKAKLPSGKGRKKVPVLDLDHAESGDDDFDVGLGTMDQELKFLQELDDHYGHCQACGLTKICKITVAGTLHHLSNNQRHAWAQALALRKNNVTLRTPPRDVAGQNLFGMFFKSVLPEAVPGPPMQNLLSGMMPPHMMGYPYMPWGPPGHPHMPSMQPIASGASPVSLSHAPHASTSALPAVIPSSDPPDMSAPNPYPEISDFLHQLNGYEPRRNMLDYIPTFAALDYYTIDEVHRLGTAEELVRVAKITHGNATYLMAQVKNEIKRVDRYRKTLA
ncbi:hypothetical protein K438DRAFT_1834934 [Mycena galopus ATCC 62051]|nr:hypothetical protein K438DRAFT_1834934 [Mycena galopus ATCC 62051]